MNKKELIKQGKVWQLFNFADRHHKNCVRINANNTYAHELAKFRKCWEIAQNGGDFLTEATLLSLKGRVDIVQINEDGGEIIEILATEKDESIENKKKRYPLPMTKIHV